MPAKDDTIASPNELSYQDACRAPARSSHHCQGCTWSTENPRVPSRYDQRQAKWIACCFNARPPLDRIFVYSLATWSCAHPLIWAYNESGRQVLAHQNWNKPEPCRFTVSPGASSLRFKTTLHLSAIDEVGGIPPSNCDRSTRLGLPWNHGSVLAPSISLITLTSSSENPAPTTTAAGRSSTALPALVPSPELGLTASPARTWGSSACAFSTEWKTCVTRARLLVPGRRTHAYK